ncbi:MAG: hypothetical protein GY757_10925 [bacterium]|nr:hypothetical protein [bacterium]
MKTKQLNNQFDLNKKTIADLTNLSNLTSLYLAIELNELNDIDGGAAYHTGQASCRFDTFCC